MESAVRRLTEKEQQLKNIDLYAADYKGKLVLFVDNRVRNFPKDCGLYKYEIRYSDCDDSIAAELSTWILVNFYGTLISDSEINLPYNNCNGKPYDIIENDEDFYCHWYYNYTALDLLLNKKYIIRKESEDTGIIYDKDGNIKI